MAGSCWGTSLNNQPYNRPCIKGRGSLLGEGKGTWGRGGGRERRGSRKDRKRKKSKRGEEEEASQWEHVGERETIGDGKRD